MQIIRSARSNEYNILTDIAVKSETYWGYDRNYMSKFKAIYCVAKEFIMSNPTVVIELDTNIIGFYGILIDKEETHLEYFFIDPKFIGQGYGKLLWSNLAKECRKLGIKKLSIVTSPQAEGFYIKMGAVHCGEVESLLKKGRMIPKLIFTIGE